MVCAKEHGNYRCGICAPCRDLKRREWIARLLLEMRYSKEAYFLTLTYDNDQVPRVGPDNPNMTLYPEHVTKYLKRLRKHGLQFRYFYVGEYGDRTHRPHYHCLLYFARPAPAELEDVLQSKWRKGFIKLDELNDARIGYIAGYTTKKLVKSHQDYEAEGIHPEFARMSRNPGIGMAYVHEASRRYTDTRSGTLVLDQRGDISTQVRINGTVYPLSRTITGKIRTQLELESRHSDRKRVAIANGCDERYWIDTIPSDKQRLAARTYNDSAVRRIRTKNKGTL